MLYIYKQAFEYYHMGYSATLGIFFAILVMLVVAVQKYAIENDDE
ncbi:MAG: sugar ABC transporter permease [Phaeodactylibacter sp.]|nr:sugar ABC transporter permease [Phaeodactylibacter sp.]